jgi:hypothetical protein
MLGARREVAPGSPDWGVRREAYKLTSKNNMLRNLTTEAGRKILGND